MRRCLCAPRGLHTGNTHGSGRLSSLKPGMLLGAFGCHSRWGRSPVLLCIPYDGDCPETEEQCQKVNEGFDRAAEDHAVVGPRAGGPSSGLRREPGRASPHPTPRDRAPRVQPGCWLLARPDVFTPFCKSAPGLRHRCLF